MPLCKELCTQEEQDKFMALLGLNVYAGVSFHLNQLLEHLGPWGHSCAGKTPPSSAASWEWSLTHVPSLTLPREWPLPRLALSSWLDRGCNGDSKLT